jgi:hypothetical protein
VLKAGGIELTYLPGLSQHVWEKGDHRKESKRLYNDARRARKAAARAEREVTAMKRIRRGLSSANFMAWWLFQSGRGP